MKAEDFPAFAVGAGAFCQPLIDVAVCRVPAVIIAADPDLLHDYRLVSNSHIAKLYLSVA